MSILKQILILKKQILLPSILFILTSFCPVIAQQVTFDRVFPPDGPYFRMINGVTQDTQGYLWFSSWGLGLSRYDGYQVTLFGNDPRDSNSLASDGANCVFADRSGFIWIGTTNTGLDRLDPRTGIFTHFTHKKEELSSLSDNGVNAILEDNDGTIWVGTENGLNRLDQQTKTFTRYHHKPSDTTSLSCNRVQVLYKDHHGTIWVGTADPQRSNDSKAQGGLNRFDRKSGKFTRYLHHPNNSHSLINNRIGAIFEDSRGVFWVSTAGDGLHTMDREKGTFERHLYDPAHPEKLSGPQPEKFGQDLKNFFVIEDSSGAIWIASSRKCVTRYDPKTKKAHHFYSLNGDADAAQAVSAGFSSREGILWLTTWPGSIFRVDPFQVTLPHVSIGISVHAVHEDFSGALWLGTHGQGLIQTDRSKGGVKRFFTDLPGPYGLSDSFINAIYEGDDSTLWIGSRNGLNHYNRKTKIFTRYVNDPKNNTSLTKGWVTAIANDKPGSLWIATEEGLDLFDIKSGRFSHYFHDPKDSTSLAGNYVSSLLKDHSGKLWAGSGKGILNLFDSRTEKFKRFPCGVAINSITEDAENIIWVGTRNGLYRSNPAVDTFLLFTDPEIGLTATTIIACILEDDKKNLWVSSSAGILRISPNRNEITVYSGNQGVDASGLTITWTHNMQGVKGKRGEFFFGDGTGYYAFFPDQLKGNKTPPQIVITDFRLADNKPVKPGKGSPLNFPITYTKEIHLKYNQNVFSFDFIGIHYSRPEEIRILYWMENLENTWRKASREKKAFYYNVPPGRYIFHVKAANSDGVWAEKNITIIITPPWWNNWWIRIAAFIFVASLLYALIRWRLHHKFRLQLERSEKEKQLAILRHKTGELEMQALRAQMSPHFIFNSLNSINMFILENNKLQASEYLSKFSRLVRLILQNSQEAFIALDKELEALGLYLELESLRFEQRFEYKISVNDEVDTTMLKVPPLIIQPYAENAIWHGLMHKKEKGHLEIELYIKDKTLFCKIADDGIGRKRAAELSTKSSLTYKSMGMRITADRIAILQQQEQNNTFISVNDLVFPDGRAAGTEVLIKIPPHYD